MNFFLDVKAYDDKHQIEKAEQTPSPNPSLSSDAVEIKQTKNISILKRRKKGKKSANYYWSEVQNRKYLQFLQLNGHLFALSCKQKKEFKVNVLMSRKIKTRTSTQCHTHHQKMMKKYLSIEAIIGLGSNKQQKISFYQPQKIKLQNPIKMIEDNFERQMLSNFSQANFSLKSMEQFDDANVMQWIDII